jgi:DNA-binding IclR family transcriptional regulator
MAGAMAGATHGDAKADAREPGTQGVAALERGLSILEAFKPGRAVLSLAELAAITGFYKSTILRLCASLLRAGYLHRLADGRYRLGAAVFRLGRIYQGSFELRDAVEPVLRNLVMRTGETASFYIRDGDSEVCLHRAASPRPVHDAGIVEGERFPIDNSACSRVLSAFSGMKGKDHDAVRRAVVVVARPSERVAGVAAVVCPVLGMDRMAAGALILSGPESRFTDHAVADMKAILSEEAAALTGLLGGDPSIFQAVRSSTSRSRS